MAADRIRIQCGSRVSCEGQVCGPSSGIHSQLQPLLDVHLDLPSAIFVKRFESTEHGVQPDQTADEVVEVHAAIFI